MIIRKLRSAIPTLALVSVLGIGVPIAAMAGTIHPAPTCGCNESPSERVALLLVELNLLVTGLVP